MASGGHASQQEDTPSPVAVEQAKLKAGALHAETLSSGAGSVSGALCILPGDKLCDEAQG